MMEAEANRLAAHREFETGTSVVSTSPVRITFDPASVCNLKCVQCYRENPGIDFVEHRSTDTVVERLKATFPKLSKLSLYGLGEPLLSPQFWKLVESDAASGIAEIDINSNGTLLSAKNIDRLLHSHLTTLKISMDGATQETFGKIRLGKLQKVTDGIARLTDRRRELGRKNLYISIHMTVMVENMHELPAMVELAYSLGVDSLWVQPLLINDDTLYDDWVIEREGWRFAYREQFTGTRPDEIRHFMTLARKTASRLNFNFACDAGLQMLWE